MKSRSSSNSKTPRKPQQSEQREAKTAKGKRILCDKEPKLVENRKKVLCVSTQSASTQTQQFILNLTQLITVRAIRIHQPVDNPMVSPLKIEELSKKADASLFVHISHNKKRPNNIVFGRLFDYRVTDMVEFSIDDFLSLSDVKSPKPEYSIDPILAFHGNGWESDELLKQFRSIFIDIFSSGVKKMGRTAIQYSINLFANQPDSDDLVVKRFVQMRSYIVTDSKFETDLLKTTQPVVMTPLGFNCSMVSNRFIVNLDQIEEARLAFVAVNKQIASGHKSKQKNVTVDEINREYITVHAHPGKLDNLNLRKYKFQKDAEDDRQEDEEGEYESEGEEYMEDE